MIPEFLLVAVMASQAYPSPMAEEIVERLAVPSTPVNQDGKIKTRGLRNLEPKSRVVDISVQFKFDSVELTDSGRSALDQLAIALRSEKLIDLRFVIEGHTDARGSREYNVALSTRRAASVLNFLVAQGVDAGRLTSIGKGFSELLNTAMPYASENRRVRVVAESK